MPAPTSKTRMKAKELRSKCLELRLLGYSFRKIADALSVSVSTAHTHIKKSLEQINAQNTELAKEMQAVQLDRYESLFLKLRTKIDKGEVAAIGQARGILDSISRLVGVEAPQKIAPTTPDGLESFNPMDMSEEEIDQRLAELEKKLSK